MQLTLTDYRRLALAAFWVGLMVTGGVFLAYIPNFEVLTTLAFLAGATFGSRRGAVIAITGEGLFSTMNPMGSGLSFPILLLFQVLAMGLIAVVGGLFRNWMLRDRPLRKSVMLGLTGAVLTFFYDFLTALSWPLTAGTEEGVLMAVSVAGLPFYTMHIVSNTLIFALFMPGLLRFTRYHLMLHGFLPAAEPS